MVGDEDGGGVDMVAGDGDADVMMVVSSAATSVGLLIRWRRFLHILTPTVMIVATKHTFMDTVDARTTVSFPLCPLC